MKEGFRSGNISGKPEMDDVSPGRRKKGSDVKQLSFDLNADEMQTVGSGTDECGVDDGLNETDRKRSRVSGVDDEDSVVKKEDVPVENVGSVGTVGSPSRMDSSGVKEVSNKVIEDEKKNTDIDDGCKEESVVDVATEQSKESDHGKVKGKRGRPRKVPESDDTSDQEMKVQAKRGRPRKVPESDNTSDQEMMVKGKRGRPRKVPESNDSSDQEMKVKVERGRPCKVQESDDFLNEGRETVEVKRGRPSKSQGTSDEVMKNKLDKGESVNELRMGENVTFEKQDGKNGKETDLEKSMGSLREEKNLVRTQIIELLLGAGWKIEYRRRFGREYKDAVYVNPEGNTHWSVTLAYGKLKEHYDKGGGNANTSQTGFTFTPIPEDELKLLKKEKTRRDKTSIRRNQKRS